MMRAVSRRWNSLATKVAYENARLRVLEDEVIQPDGARASYFVVEERQGAVIVVAVADDGRIAFVRQHRYPIDTVTLELPAGEVPEGANAIEQARAELGEETGIVAGELEVIGRFPPWPARARRWSEVVLASHLDLHGLGLKRQAGDESIEDVVLLGPGDLGPMIRSGNVVDGSSLAALQLYSAHRA